MRPVAPQPERVMRFLASIIPVILLAVGCTAQPDPDTPSETSSEVKVSQSSSKKNPKWKIAVDGLPEKSGSIITAITQEGYGKYALGGSKVAASIGLDRDDPNSLMVIRFMEENVRCVGNGNATATRDGDRAIVGGEVMCFPIDGSFDEAEPASIEGYFEVQM